MASFVPARISEIKIALKRSVSQIKSKKNFPTDDACRAKFRTYIDEVQSDLICGPGAPEGSLEASTDRSPTRQIA
jgi:hypothetical protein